MKLAGEFKISIYSDCRVPDDVVLNIMNDIDNSIYLQMNGITCIIQDAFDKRSIEYLKSVENYDRPLSVDLINCIDDLKSELK